MRLRDRAKFVTYRTGLIAEEGRSVAGGWCWFESSSELFGKVSDEPLGEASMPRFVQKAGVISEAADSEPAGCTGAAGRVSGPLLSPEEHPEDPPPAAVPDDVDDEGPAPTL